jgi:EAL domain-containing protein (putative c-di-GMP-specific phosphodiesterase class I)
VVAEGVETVRHADRLREHGYTDAQGYHFARPMTAERISETLTSQQAPLTRAAAMA